VNAYKAMRVLSEHRNMHSHNILTILHIYSMELF